MASSDDAVSTKLRLQQEITALKAELVPVFQRDKERVEAEGRPFNALAWWGGELDDGKYPGGPAFYVRFCGGLWGLCVFWTVRGAFGRRIAGCG